MQSVKEILATALLGSVVTATGWVKTRRDVKSCSFIELSDGTSLGGLQAVLDSGMEGYKEIIEKLTTGSSVRIEGTIVASLASGQRIELSAVSVYIYSVCPPEYPLQKKQHSFEFLREIAHLRPRTNSIGAVLRIRSVLSFAVHRFFQDRGFQYVHTPIISTSDCEGAGKQFTVTTYDALGFSPKESYADDFFGGHAHLTVSGQLEGEICALALRNIYTFGPTFRAELSNTARHLAEFWMIEPEMAFCELVDDMNCAEAFVRFCVGEVLAQCPDEIAFFTKRIDSGLTERLEALVKTSFERISYTDAMIILEKNNAHFEYPVSFGSDIQSEHERYLVEEVFKKPTIVYNYPSEIKAFYMKANDDGKTVRAMDLLVPRIGELIGGSEREDRHDVLKDKILAMGLNPEDYWWYLDLRKYGSVPHAGFGLGFERLMLLVTGMLNIRDVIPFPRYPGNAAF